MLKLFKIQHLIFITITVFFLSCSTKPVVKFKIDKRTINLGDSVKVKWEIKESRKITNIILNNTVKNLSFTGDTVLFLKHDTTLELRVYKKNIVRPVKRRRKIEVINPKIIAFAAFRDRFDSLKVKLVWHVKGVESVSIEGFKGHLPLKGQDSIYISVAKSFNLIAKTPFQTLTQTCYVEEMPSQVPYIKNDTAIYELSDKTKIKIKIIETENIKKSKEIKLKVIAFDTLGNFITHLAPPFGSKETAEKYFKKIVEKVDDHTSEIEFEVKEIHESPNLYDIALTLDYSGSMYSNINLLEASTKYFIKEKYPEDNYSIIKYDHNLTDPCPLINDIDEIIKNANFKGLDILGGATALYAGIDKGLESLNNAANKKVVMLFTDGYENSSLAYIGQYAATINEAIDVVRNEDAKLIIIGLGWVNVRLLQELAYYTNGTFYYVQNTKDIYKVYQELIHNFRTYYEITIKPVKKEGEHIVQLTYFNNNDTTTTQRPYYIGNSIDFLKYEEDTNAYWYNKNLKSKRYKLASAPQTLINFDLDKDNIRKEYINSLKNIIKFINKNHSIIIKIYGHTDTKGSDEYNQELSERRAKAVRNYLIRHGIRPNRIEWLGMGEKYPVWKNDDADWASRENRRVEIVLWKR